MLLVGVAKVEHNLQVVLAEQVKILVSLDLQLELLQMMFRHQVVDPQDLQEVDLPEAAADITVEVLEEHLMVVVLMVLPEVVQVILDHHF